MASHEHHHVSNHCDLHCLFNSLFRLSTKKTILHTTGPLWGEFTVRQKGPIMQKTFNLLYGQGNTWWRNIVTRNRFLFNTCQEICSCFTLFRVFPCLVSINLPMSFRVTSPTLCRLGFYSVSGRTSYLREAARFGLKLSEHRPWYDNPRASEATLKSMWKYIS